MKTRTIAKSIEIDAGAAAHALVQKLYGPKAVIEITAITPNNIRGSMNGMPFVLPRNREETHAGPIKQAAGTEAQVNQG